MTHRFIVRAGLAAILATGLMGQGPPRQGCGTQGGPGYRDPDGRCVAWAEIRDVCGCPPTNRCTPENVAAGADAAACNQSDGAHQVTTEKEEEIPLEERHRATLLPGDTLLLHFRAKITSIHVDTPDVLTAEPTQTVPAERTRTASGAIQSVRLKALDKLGSTRVVIYGDRRCPDAKCTEVDPPSEYDAKLYDAVITVIQPLPPPVGHQVRVYSSAGLRQPWVYNCLQSHSRNGEFPCKRADERQAQPIPPGNRSEQIIEYREPRGQGQPQVPY